ncbi:ABC transporter permease [Solibacillus sp. FSL H8-0538]|uniref:ABC transporter permease n=1 Tax=Solibacillus sp. FSL H8-0538 TaxID=2921400 RepID=UPI0030F5AA3C
MNQFNVFLRKEWRESWRSFKFIWIPLVFIMLGVSDPILNYFMDDIMQSVGNMPEGFSMTMPEFQPVDLLLASTGQFQSIGLIILIAVFAGSVSRERQNGTATLLYVRPISFRALFLSKWTVASLVAISSAMAGYTGSMYYTAILYGTVNWSKFAAMLGTYFVWLVFVMAVTLAMSAVFKTIIAATLSIVIVPIGLIMDSLIGSFWTVTPWKLPGYGVLLLTDSVSMTDYWWCFGLTLALTILFIVLGMYFSKRNASTVKV